MSTLDNLEDHQIAALREHLTGNFRAFAHFYFRVMTGSKLIEVDYYNVLFDFLQDAIEHKKRRQVISISPRAGKTLIIGQMLILFAWVRNPSSQNISTGFNGDVLAESAGFIRSVMSNEDFRRVFPETQLDAKKQSVTLLGTTKAGSSHFITTSSRITGKGAGIISSKEFAGVLCLDDPLKASDMFSVLEREKANYNITNTLMSRLGRNETPFIVIMQRLGIEDPVGHLLTGGSGEDWDWLCIPAIITPDVGSEAWYQRQIDKYGYSHAKPYVYDLKRGEGRSSFWHDRKSLEALDKLKEADEYTFMTQYMQEPYSLGSSALKEEDIHTYVDVPWKEITSTFMVGDTASTTQNYSDYSVVTWWGLTRDGNLYLLDMLRGKYEVPELIEEVKNFWINNSVFDPNLPTKAPRYLALEDKASGQMLNQMFAREGKIRLKPIKRDSSSKDKFTRWLDVVPMFGKGQIRLPRNTSWFLDVKRECLGMHEKGNDTGHDDIVDTISDAGMLAFTQKPINYESWY